MVSKKKIKPGQQVNDELENGIKVEQGLMIYELFFSGRCFRVTMCVEEIFYHSFVTTF